MPATIQALRDHLVAEGMATRWDDRAFATLAAPAIVIEPHDGVPTPAVVGPDARVVLALITAPGVPTTAYESFFETDYIDVVIRTSPRGGGSATARHVARQLRLLLNDRRDWEMAGLRVLESLCARPEQIVFTDEAGYYWTMQFSFLVTQPALAG